MNTRKLLFLLGGAMALMPIVILVAAGVDARLAPLAGALGCVVFVVALLFGLKRLWELHFVLELSESHARLSNASGVVVASIPGSPGILFTKTNYTRRARHSAWLRPGFRMQFAGGDVLIGTLLPESAWEQTSHDPRTPHFELRRDEFAALDAFLRADPR